MSSPKLRTSQTGWKSATQFGQIPTTCSFHLTSLSLARQTNRKCNRPKPPTHPSVPSFKLSLNEPSHLSSARRQSIRIKSQKNLDEFAWKHDSCKNVLRRRDSVTGKFIHAKKDWMADPKRNFLKIKWEDRLIRLDKDYVDERKRDFHEQQQAEEEEDGGEKLSRPPKQMWKLPRQEFNRGAPTQVHKYGRERLHLYTHEQRKALSEPNFRGMWISTFLSARCGNPHSFQPDVETHIPFSQMWKPTFLLAEF
ncbi:hypothetical protein Pst134EA_021309 [Puccinia striiformis f. sp. tritici]|uniref:hypothetical protein n=1 Tax=Puccinia striiformis f. sp. tritici TaxID=168172 RepID=UPI0020087321|nr:hypothetical protein Pst134EA_021309 [Puccinia striiformis f. sp. tritici]KAH9457433.1 hypothetical protein Pst134EA_021309 [Puccinia striiformis f. sp. tritici]